MKIGHIGSFSSNSNLMTSVTLFLTCLVVFSFTVQAGSRIELGPYMTFGTGLVPVISWSSAGTDLGGLDYDKVGFYVEHEKLRNSVENLGKEGKFVHARLENLDPGTQYVYRIGDESGPTAG